MIFAIAITATSMEVPTIHGLPFRTVGFFEIKFMLWIVDGISFKVRILLRTA